MEPLDQIQLCDKINIHSTSEKLTFLQNLWSDLNAFFHNMGDENIVCMGDFNIALTELDIVSGSPHPTSVCQEFHDFQKRMGFTDSWRLLHPNEKCFSWSRPNPPTARRLD